MVKVFDWFVTFAGVFSVAVGLLGLLGWMSGIAVLKSWIPGQVMIKANAAIGLVAVGLSLLLLRTEPGQRLPWIRKLGGRLLASATGVLGLLSLMEHVAGWDLGIDQLLFRDGDPWEAFGSVRPGLMAPITALDFFIAGLALLSLDWAIAWRSRRFWPAQLFAILMGIGSIVGLLDFVLDAQSEYSRVALPTAVTGSLVALALVIARTDRGLAALLASSSLGGSLTRRFLPAGVAIPVLIGSLSWKAHAIGAWSEWAGIALMIVSMMVLLSSLVAWKGSVIDRADVERRAAERALRRSEDELHEAQRLARVGSWWWDPATERVTWSPELSRMVGRDPSEPEPSYYGSAQFFAPESAVRIDAAMQRARKTGAGFELDLEMIRVDGARLHVTSLGEVERDADGRIVLVRGTVEDVTERKRAEDALRESEARLNRAQEIAHLGSWHLDVVHDVLSWSDEVFRIFGIPRGTPLSYQTFVASIHPDDRARVDEAWNAALGGAPYEVEHRILVDGEVKWVRELAKVELDARGKVVEGIGTVQDITERKRAQVELMRINRALRTLSDCNAALIRAADEAALLQRICEIVVDESGYRMCGVGRAETDAARSVTPVARAGFDAGYLDELNLTWADVERGRGPAGTCVRTHEIVVAEDIAIDPRMAPWREAALQRGYASCIAIPLVVDSHAFGSINIYSAERDPFCAAEVALLNELAADLAFGMTALRTRAARARGEEEIRLLNVELQKRVAARTAELHTVNEQKELLIVREQATSAELERAHEREADIGYRIQQTLLLDQPPMDVPGLRVAALSVPSQRISGDFYVFINHQDQVLDVIVGDVMGKGIHAGLLGAATKSHFLKALGDLASASGGQTLPSPKDIVMLAHAGVARQLIDLESFVTLCYARLDMTRHRLEFVDCGHTGIVHLHGRTGLCELLRGNNLPLGVREGEIYDQFSVPVEPGDSLLLFSDGITEARGRAGEIFGFERLDECVRRHGALGPQGLIDAVSAAVADFTGGQHLADDLTSVAIHVDATSLPVARGATAIHSDLGELRQARAFVRGFCRRLPGGPLDDLSTDELEMAVNEAASNIIKHAYRGRPDQSIDLECEAFGDRVAIRLHHLGAPFDRAAAAPPAFDGSRESGFGAYIIDASVDEVRYYQDTHGRNCIALVKNRTRANEAGRRWSS